MYASCVMISTHITTPIFRLNAGNICVKSSLGTNNLGHKQLSESTVSGVICLKNAFKCLRPFLRPSLINEGSVCGGSIYVLSTNCDNKHSKTSSDIGTRSRSDFHNRYCKFSGFVGCRCLTLLPK